MAEGYKKPRKAINKMVSIFPRHLEILKHIKTDKGMGSDSEVIRAALIFFHDKHYPNYIFHLSPTAKRKEKEDKEEEETQESSPADFVRSIGGVVLPTTDGREVGFIRGPLNNSRLDHFLVEDIKAMMDVNHRKHFYVAEWKDYAAINTAEALLQRDYLNNESIGEIYRKRVYNSLPVIFPGFENEHEKITSQSSDQSNNEPVV